MKIPEPSIVLYIFDYILKPFMWILNGFKFPLQETHSWHVSDFASFKLPQNKKLIISLVDKDSRFSHGSPFGLFHMPIFGGLTKYVVVEAKAFKNYWHVIWGGGEKYQIHKLPIYDNKLKLLIGHGGYNLLGIDDAQKFVSLKIVGSGIIGDKRYNGVRLF